MTPVQEYLLARDMWASVAVKAIAPEVPTRETAQDRSVLANRIRILERKLTTLDLPYLKEHLTPYVYDIVYDRLTQPKPCPTKYDIELPWDA